MCFDINFTVDVDDFDEFKDLYISAPVDFYKMTFTPNAIFHTFIQKAISAPKDREINHKIQKQVPSKCKTFHASINGSLEARIEWGGNDGIKTSVEISGGVHDDQGNRVEISVEQNSNGQGNATISVSCDSDQDQPDVGK